MCVFVWIRSQKYVKGICEWVRTVARLDRISKKKTNIIEDRFVFVVGSMSDLELIEGYQMVMCEPEFDNSKTLTRGNK